ncbi:MAG: PA14 domain-containing protein [Tepidisphaeraceae bacterium]
MSTNATLQIDSGATLAANTIQASANIVLSGGTIQGATVAESGGSELVLLSGGTLNNVTVSAGTVLDATQQWDAQITILNGLTLNGTLEVGGADGSTFAYFLFNGTQMLGGTGSVVFGNYYYYYYYTNGLYAQGDNGANPATLTVGSGITIDGGNGDVSGYYSGDAIVNQGTIDADVAGGTIYVANNGSGLSNSGTLEATAGTLNVGGGSTPWSNGGNLIVSGTGVLDLGGVFTQAGLGTFTRTGGTVNLTGTLTGNLALSSATGSWNLAGGTIAGGTVTATGGAELVLTGSGGTLDGVTIGSGTVLDGTQQWDANATILDGLTLNGTVELGGSTYFYGSLYFQGTQTLGGTGSVVFGTSWYANSGLYVYDVSTPATLTIGSGITVHGGNGQVSAQSGDASIINDGTINADTSGETISVSGDGNPGTFTNDGTLEATSGGSLSVSDLAGNIGVATVSGSGSSLTLNGTNYVNNLGLTAPAGTTLALNGTWINPAGQTITATGATLDLGDQSSSSTNAWFNAGTISATNSTVNLGGSFTLASLGTFNRSGGTVNLTGTLTGNLAFSSATGSWNLAGGTIAGGTISGTDGAELVLTVRVGTLDGVTIDQGTVVDGTQENCAAIILHGLTLDGTLNLGAPDGSTSGQLGFTGMQTLDGTGSVVFGGSSQNFLMVEDIGIPATLTIGSGITIEGKRGGVAGSYNYNSIVNEGIIDADTSGGTISVSGGGNPGNFTNDGTLEASNGGSLSVSNLAGNIGVATVSDSGSSLTLNGTNYVNNLGLSAPAGTTLALDGTWTNPAGQTITATGATLDLGDQSSSSTNAWSNAGTINATDSTVNLGGSITQASVGTLNRIGGTVNITGTLTGGLSVDNTTGSWNLAGGTIAGGTVSGTGGAELVLTGSGGTLDGVTIGSGTVVDGTQNYCGAMILDGLTLDGTLNLGASDGSSYGRLYFIGTQTLDGTGSVVFGNYWWWVNGLYVQDNGSAATLTIGSGITVHGGNGQVSAQNGDASIVNDGTINADTSGGTISVSGGGSPGTFTNDGTLEATNGGSLSVSNLAGNIGVATVSDSGSSLTLNGTNYVNNLGLSAPAGTTLALDGTWINPAGQTITATGATLDLGDQSSSSTNAWSNAGIITATDSTVNLGGSITQASVGTLNRIGGTVSITGTLTGGLSLDDTTGSWNLAGGTIAGGTIRSTGGAELVLTNSGGTLDGVTIGSGTPVDGTQQWGAGATILDGLTLDGTLNLGASDGSTYGQLHFTGTQTLDGTGSVMFGNYNYYYYYYYANGLYVDDASNAGPATLTIGSGITVEGDAGQVSAQSGDASIVNEGIIDADTSGGTISVSGGGSPGTFTNDGTLEASNGGSLSVSSLAGNIGVATVSDSGSSLTLNGANYVNNLGLSAPAGTTLALDGTWVNPAGQTITATGATLDLGDQSSSSTNAWSNAGTINATDSTVNLGGSITQASVGTLNRIGGTVSITGTLTGGLSLDDTTGSWNLAGGTIAGGTVTATGDAELVLTGSGGRLDGVTIGSGTPVDGTQAYCSATILDGLTLDGTLNLGASDSGTYGRLYFTGTQTLDGTGSVVFGGSGGNGLFVQDNGSAATLTIGSGITVHGGNGQVSAQNGDASIVNGGTINADTSGETIGVSGGGSPGTFTNDGTLEATNGGSLSVSNLAGNIGVATVSDSGSSLTLNGTNYVNNLGLSAPAGTALQLDGTWINPAGQTITATGATLDLGDQPSSSTNAWFNAGTITATNSTVNLGGEFTLTDLGTLNRSGGTVNITGTLDLLPVAPSALSVASGENYTVLSWSDNSTVESGYAIERSTDGVHFSQVGTVGANVTEYYDTGLTAGTTYTYRVRAYNTVGNSLYSNTASAKVGTLGAGLGLLAQFYNDTDLSGTPVLTQVYGNVDTNWNYGGGPGSGVNGAGNFSGRWTGQLKAPTSETYTFNAQMDYGSAARVWINDQLVYDNWDSGATVNNEVALTAGQTYDFKVEYDSNYYYYPGVHVYWSSPSVSNEVIPASAFTLPAGAGAELPGNTPGPVVTVVPGGDTLALDDTTGSWNLAGGTIAGGTISATDGAELVLTGSGGTLDGVTIGSGTPVDGTQNYSRATILDGLTLDGTLNLGASDGSTYGQLYFTGTQTLDGTGSVVFGGSGGNGLFVQDNGSAATLTIGSGITIQGNSGLVAAYYYGDASIVNEGIIDADTSGGTMSVSGGGDPGTFTNDGMLEAQGGTLYLNGTVLFTGQGVISSSPTGSIQCNGSLLGSTTNAAGWTPQGPVTFDGSGNASSPQLLEAMSDDLGANAIGFQGNFAYARLSLSGNTYVQLVDQSQNAGGSGANAVYAASLSVPAGATLDLNGLNLYTLAADVTGTVLNGSVTVLPGGGFPDLSPQSAAASTSNGIVTVVWNDINNGGGNVIDSFYDQVQLIDVTAGNTVLDTQTPYYNEGYLGPITYNGGTAPEQVTFNLAGYSQFHVGDTLEAVITTDVNDNVFETNKANNQATTSVTQAPVPDLQVNGLSVTGDSTGQVNINWNDGNNGPGTVAESFFDSVVVTDNVTGATVFSGTVYVNAGQNPISSGASVAQSDSFQLPTGFDVTHALNVSVTTDAYNNVFETNENNNTATLATTAPLAQYPDLQVQDLSVSPTNPFAGQQITISWNDANTGAATAAGPWYDQIQVINTTTGQSLLDTTQYYASNSMAAGGNAARSYALTLPNGSAGAGVLQVTVTVNSNNDVFEYNSSLTAQSNNSSSMNVTSAAVSYPDLTVANLTAAEDSTGKVTISWLDSNIGIASAASAFDDSITLTDVTTGLQINATTLRYDPSQSGDISAGSSSGTRTVAFQLPQGFSATDALEATVQTDSDGGVYDSNPDNNTSSANVSTVASADLSVTNLSGSGDATGKVTVSWQDANAAGGAAVASAFYDSITLIDTTTGQTINSTSLRYDPTSSGSIAAGSASAVRTVSFQLPQGFSATDALQVTVQTDTDNGVYQSNLSNDTSTQSVSRTPTADLSVANLSAGADATGLVTVSWEDANAAGAASVTGSFTDYVTLIDTTTNQVLGSGGVPYSVSSLGPISGGSMSVARTTTFQLPQGLSASDVLQAQVVTNGDAGVYEANTANDTATTSVTTTPTADLSVADVQITTATPLSGQPVGVSWQDSNTGPAATGTSWLDQVVVRDFSNNIVASDTVAAAALAAGQSETCTFQFTLPHGNPGVGSFTVVVTTNSNAAVFENNTANNVSAPVTFTSTRSSTDYPDLAVSSVTGPGFEFVGQQTQVSWTVVNNGPVEADGSWTDQLQMISVSTGAVTTLANVDQTGPLAPGTSYTTTQTITLPTTPGQYFFQVTTDVGNTVVETNEGNNTAASVNNTVSALYDATITFVTNADGVDVAAGDAGHAYIAPGAPVLIYGVATYTGSGETGMPAAGMGVTVDVMVQGTVRTLNATTASDGTFGVEFYPVGTEAGHYQLAADHISTGAVAGSMVPQAAFDIVGLTSNPFGISQTLVVNQPVTGTITLSALGVVNLTGLTFNAVSIAPNIQLVLTGAPTTIAAGGTATITFTLQASDDSYVSDSAELHVSSDQGVALDIGFDLNVLVLKPQLVSSTGALDVGMIVPAAGQQVQEQVSFVVTNIGGADSGDLTVQVPDTSVDGLAPFMTLVTQPTISSLAPGQSATVTIQLSADPSLPLNELYTGTIAIGNTQVSLSEGYSFRPIATTTGDVVVQVSDDYTQYAANHPYVSGALVQLLNAFDNSQVVATGTTDATGTVAFASIPAGPYVMSVSDSGHSSYLATINVNPGVTNNETAFLPVNTVSYTWVVVPTQIQDQYQVSLVATFDTQVPAPVVTMTADPHPLLPLIAPGGRGQLNLTLTNQGLIAANDVTLIVPTDPEYTFTPLTTDIGIIGANQSVTIPVAVTRNTGGPDGGASYVYFSAPYDYVPFDDPNQTVVHAALAAVFVRPGPPPPPPQPGGPSGPGAGTGTGTGGFYPTPVVPIQTEIADAKVTIEIDQSAVLTRTAFGGTLDISNTGSTPLANVQMNIHITDDAGNDATSDFFFNPPTLSGFNASGGIDPGTDGTAKFLFVPTDNAAMTAATDYHIGGSFSYTDAAGEVVTVPIFPATITVYPQAHLVLNYFLQRDVYGDNPFTPQVEPAEPFVLGLLVTNVGAGAAGDLTITSDQPKIIDNTKGLLINFQVIGTQVGTQTESQPSLTADLGTLAPGQTNSAEFNLICSLQGHFENYSASFTHTGALGGLQTSLIDSVTLHELIHAVNLDDPGDPASDGKPDFLAHDSASGKGATRDYGQAQGPTGMLDVVTDLPEVLYKSDGSKSAVNDLAVGDASITSTVQSGQSLTYTLTASEAAGWDYLEIPDPTGSHSGYTLTSVVGPDGRVIQVGPNAWTTDQLFTDGAFINFKLFHMLDYSSTGQDVQYTLVYTTTATPPTVVALQAVSPKIDSPFDSLQVTLSEPIDLTSFDPSQVVILYNGSPISTAGMTLKSDGGDVYEIDGLSSLTNKLGSYALDFNATAVRDFNGLAGTGVLSDLWQLLAVPTLTLPAAPALTFDGTSDVVEWVTATLSGVNGVAAPTGTPSIAYYSGTDTSGTPLSSPPVNAGKYTAVASYAGDANYFGVQTSVTFTVNPAPATVTLPAPPASIVYDGTNDVTSWVQATVTGVSGAPTPTGEITYVYYAGAAATGTPLASPPINPGTYTVVANYPGDANYNAAQSDAVTFSIVAPPQVTNVTVDGSAWSGSFLSYLAGLSVANVGGYSIPTGSSQLKTLPWTNLNQINIVFNQNVNVQESSLQLLGVNVPSYSFIAFSYNSSTDTATWTLNAPISDDKLLIDLSDSVTNTSGVALDGEWTDGVSSYPSGNGTPGGAFMFSLNVLPGDENQSGGVNILDTVSVAHLQGSTTLTPATYSIFADVNGSGGINILDTLATNSRQASTLPSGTPAVPAVVTSMVAAPTRKMNTTASTALVPNVSPMVFSTTPITSSLLLPNHHKRGVLAMV